MRLLVYEKDRMNHIVFSSGLHICFIHANTRLSTSNVTLIETLSFQCVGSKNTTVRASRGIYYRPDRSVNDLERRASTHAASAWIL